MTWQCKLSLVCKRLTVNDFIWLGTCIDTQLKQIFSNIGLCQERNIYDQLDHSPEGSGIRWEAEDGMVSSRDASYRMSPRYQYCHIHTPISSSNCFSLPVAAWTPVWPPVLMLRLSALLSPLAHPGISREQDVRRRVRNSVQHQGSMPRTHLPSL